MMDAEMAVCRLRDLDGLTRRLTGLTAQTVMAAREAGVTWAEIGEAAGGLSAGAAADRWLRPEREGGRAEYLARARERMAAQRGEGRPGISLAEAGRRVGASRSAVSAAVARGGEVVTVAGRELTVGREEGEAPRVIAIDEEGV